MIEKGISGLVFFILLFIAVSVIFQLMKPFLIIFGIILTLTIILVIGVTLFRVLNNKSRYF